MRLRALSLGAIGCLMALALAMVAPTGVYNPYPPGILPSDLTSEIARVRREIAGIEREAIAQWKALGPVTFVGQPPTIQGNGYEAKKYGVRSAFLSAKGGSSLLAELATLVDSGQIRPMVDKVLPLSEARQAHELIETGHARGKIVLKVA